ncbi:hypothetical protein GCM10010442_70650 [Kitasatospora kifunensis]
MPPLLPKKLSSRSLMRKTTRAVRIRPNQPPGILRRGGAGGGGGGAPSERQGWSGLWRGGTGSVTVRTIRA